MPDEIHFGDADDDDAFAEGDTPPLHDNIEAAAEAFDRCADDDLASTWAVLAEMYGDELVIL